MERLKGKTILIGREEGNSRLMITVSDGKVKKGTYIGQPGTVPNTVSRCIPAQNIAHCSIVIDHNGTMTLSNLKAKNVTYVNGTAVARKAVTASDRVELGKTKFQINIAEIINIAERIITAATGRQQQPQNRQPQQQQPQPAYSISHLEKVWNDYQNGLKEIQEEQYKVNILSRVPFFFTIVSGAITALSNSFGWPKPVFYLTGALTAIGVILFIYGLYRLIKFHNGTEKKEQIINTFKHNYNCPNCGNFLGNTDFFIIKNKGFCPFCRCKWKD